MLLRDRLFIDGAWVAPSGKQSIDVHNAGNGEVMGRVPLADDKDVERAVAAARSAGGAIAVDLGHHFDGAFHGARIAALGAVGKMPRVESGEQRDAKTYVSAGLAVTLGLGAAK